MANQLNSSSLTPLRTATAARLAAVAMVALLAGCSSVPDAVNPVEWYKGARDMVSGDDSKVEPPENGEAPNRVVAERGQPAPGADEPIPDLNSVPEQRPQTATRIERERIQRGLVADRESARRYSSEVVRRQGDPVNPLNTAPQTASPPAVSSPEPQRRSETRSGTRSEQDRQPEQAPTPPARPRTPVQVEPAPRQPSPEASAQSSPPPRQPSSADRAPPTPPRQPDPADSAPPAPPQMAAVPSPEEAPRPSARLAPVPSFSSSGDGGTVIVSSAGVQNSGSFRRLASAPAPTSVSSETGARPLAEFDPSGRRGSYQVATIQFANGSSALSARDKSIIRQVAAQQRELGGTVRVVGHASSRTRALDMVRHKMVNFRVSAARADAVAQELIRNGMDPNNLFVGAVSDRNPKFHEFMPTGEAGNRRAEIFIDF